MLFTTTNVQLKRTTGPTIVLPDLQVRERESILLLGPSGSGKTTLLSIMAGLLPPTEGRIFFRDYDIYQLTSAARDHLRGQNFGFIFQTLHLLSSLTLSQNILLAQSMSGKKAEAGRFESLLKTLDLHEKSQRKPAALSQGEQQRAAIARAVLLQPAIIFADEPTSALDDANALRVIELLKKQASECGSALLVATHDTRLLGKLERTIELQ